QQFVPPDVRIPAGRRLVAAAGLLLLLLGLAAAWRWTPLGELLDVAWLSDQLASFGRRPLAPALTVSAFVLGGLLVLPVTLLVIVTALAFGPVAGFAYSLAGALTSAAVLYGLGRWLGRDVVRRFAGPRVNRLSRRLASRGLLTVVFVRVVPVAPFSVVNLVAGASAIGLRDYLVGTLLGMAPGIALIALFVDRVNATLREPALEALWTLGAIAALFLLVIWVLRRFIALRQKPRPAGESGEQYPGSSDRLSRGAARRRARTARGRRHAARVPCYHPAHEHASQRRPGAAALRRRPRRQSRRLGARYSRSGRARRAPGAAAG